jgi:hypothetical protein
MIVTVVLIKIAVYALFSLSTPFYLLIIFRDDQAGILSVLLWQAVLLAVHWIYILVVLISNFHITTMNLLRPRYGGISASI